MMQRLVLLLLLCPFITNAQIITTIAGTGIPGYSGDGGPAIAAQLDNPTCIKFDHLGNKYIADHFNHVIRKISNSGVITTIAGNGFGAGTTHGGYSGDGGQATNAKLFRPSDVAFDAAGNLYIAELGNCRIRKVTPSGIISTFAGTGACGYDGDGGPAANAKINDPFGLVFDNEGNLSFSNNGYNVVRKINTLGIISTVAGTGVSGYSGDGGLATAAKVKLTGFLALSPSGELYITDYTNYRVRKIDASGIISTVAGTGMSGNTGDGGPATAAQIGMAAGIVFDPLGNIYITDILNYVIRKIDIAGTITTIAGNGTQGYSGDGGPATAAQFNVNVNCSAVDTWGNLYIADYGNNRIRRITYNTAGVENANEMAARVSIYPNPANENINIVNTTKIEEIDLFDIWGHKLNTLITSISDKEVQINIEQLLAGIYFVNVNGINAGKFVKQ